MILLVDDAVYVILIELEVLKILSKKSSCVEVFCEFVLYLFMKRARIFRRQKIASKLAKYGKIKVMDAKFIPENFLPGSHLSILTSDNVLRSELFTCFFSWHL